jgi:raffinose synthase
MTPTLIDFVGHSLLEAEGSPLLEGLAPELSAQADPLGNGVFIVARAAATSSRHRFGLGKIPKLARFSACHRDEAYWMQPCAGTRLSEVPPETQSLLVELEDGRFLFVIPLIDELFRFSLLGKGDDSLGLLAETGDAFATGTGGLAAFVTVGADPFALAREGAKSVMARLGTGKLRRDKPTPDIVAQFGWCTWDAFYADVSADKVREGLRSFRAGGVSPRLLILDDGWQSVERQATGETRLSAFAANSKFKGDLSGLVQSAKQEFGVESFLVWHAVVGYWGGVDAQRLPGYGVLEQTRQFCEGVLFHQPSTNYDWWGNVVGLVPAAHIARFYDDYHRSLAAQGVDGVKVDSQAVLEAVAVRQGGRVPLTRAYRAGLEASVQRHFEGRLINCMSNAQETWYGSSGSTLIRSSIDFFPLQPESHGKHLYSNAQVGLWFGEFMHPDWDMFQSGHEWGAYHAAARAVSGGPVYVSDKVGAQDFELLKRLVCSDGSVLLCDGPGVPTRDVLCHDPTREEVLLKVWNTVGRAGLVAVFNARVGTPGAAGAVLSGAVGPSDVPALTGERFACYLYNAARLQVLNREERVSLELPERGFELLTFVPIEQGFAAIGLADKLNSAGGVARSSWSGTQSCELELRDGGAFLAYSERAPTAVTVAGQPAAFSHETESCALRVVSEAKGRHVLVLTW